MAIRVILAEDHQMFRQAMRMALAARKDIEVIEEADNGWQAVEFARTLLPDIVVMDIGMARLNGIEATLQIRADAIQTQVIILSQYVEQEQVIRALRAGARGYVIKHAAIDELMLAIQAVHAGQPYLSPAILQPVLDGYLIWVEEQGASPLERLTPRERQVLQLVAEGKINQEIATELDLGVRTVETHRANLMSKLEVHNVAELVRFAIRHSVISNGL